MIDFRYHMASLIAVFLALGIGILIGCLIFGGAFQEALIIEQGEWMARLEKDFTQVKDEMIKLRTEAKNKDEEIAFLEQFLINISPYFMENRLTGKNILLCEAPQSDYGLLLEDLLRKAGADTINRISFDLNQDDPNLLDFRQDMAYVNHIDGVICVFPPKIGQNKSFDQFQDLLIGSLTREFPLCIIDHNHPHLEYSGVPVIDNIDTLWGQMTLIISLEKIFQN